VNAYDVWWGYQCNDEILPTISMNSYRSSSFYREFPPLTGRGLQKRLTELRPFGIFLLSTVQTPVDLDLWPLRQVWMFSRVRSRGWNQNKTFDLGPGCIKIKYSANEPGQKFEFLFSLIRKNWQTTTMPPVMNSRPRIRGSGIALQKNISKTFHLLLNHPFNSMK
jgi:hypothetical protein